ncbi:cobaltochelatase subunit CobN, partial [Klebsiella pneumoniae]
DQAQRRDRVAALLPAQRLAAEAQALHALGLRPRWDAGGRLLALDIVPAAELGRPRVDVVLQVASVYRDQFDGFMRLLAEA